MADIPASNWNEADSSNTTAAPDGAPEGMSPSGVNDVLRAHQGAVKRWYKWSTPITTAGTSTTFTATYSVTPGALVDGMTHLVQFNAANGNAPTLNINSLGATPLHYFSAGAWRVVPAALWDADEIFRVAYNTAAGAYRLLDFRNRTGEVTPYAGATAPAGTLLCFGQAISRTAYVGLFTALGTAHGVGDGSTTFNLPDLRGRAAAGKSDMGGVDAGNLTGGGVLGAGLGAQTHTHQNSGGVSGTIPSLPVNVSGTTAGPGQASNAQAGISQPTTDTNHTHAFTGAGSTGASGVPGSWTLNGSTAAGSSVQPTLILNYLIRT